MNFWIYVNVFYKILKILHILFSYPNNSKKYLSFLQSFLNSCNSSIFKEFVMTIKKFVSIFVIKIKRIFLYLFCNSFSVIFIFPKIFFEFRFFRLKAIVFAFSNFDCLLFFNKSIAVFL